MKTFITEIENFASEFDTGYITLSDTIVFKVKEIIQTITHYILSKYTTAKGDNVDNQGNRLPFRNIGNAIVDLEFRAKNIDRKAIEPVATDGDWVFSLIVKKELQQFLKEENFGKLIDDYQYKKSAYGNALLKKTGNEDIDIDVVQWSNMMIDVNDISKGIKIEKYYLFPSEIIKKKDVWVEEFENENAVDALLRKYKGQNIKERRIEVWDIEGEFDTGVFEDKENQEYKLYNVILGILGKEKIILHKKELKESRYKFDKRKEIEGVDWGLGVWQEVFEPQIWTNEAVIAEKEVMDIAGKVIIATNKKNLPSALTLYNGEVIDLGIDEYIKPVSLAPNTLPEFQNQINNWFINMQRDQSAFPAVSGEPAKAGTPFAAQALQASQSGSIFNKRRDQDGFFIVEVIKDWILPFLVKKINKEHKLFAAYSKKEQERIDKAIKTKASRKFLKEKLLSPDFLEEGTPPVSQEDLNQVENQTQALLDEQEGREIKIPKGYITMEKIKTKLIFDLTDEMVDSQRKLNALTMLLQSMSPQDPERTEVIKEIIEISGLSAVTFSVGSIAQPPPERSEGVLQQVLQKALPVGQQ